jgi:hypothetical protein
MPLVAGLLLLLLLDPAKQKFFHVLLLLLEPFAVILDGHHVLAVVIWDGALYRVGSRVRAVPGNVLVKASVPLIERDMERMR